MLFFTVFFDISICKTNTSCKNENLWEEMQMRRHNNYDDYDLDPNYDESNVDLDSYEREADIWEDEMAEGVTVKNYADTNDPVCDRLHNWNDCFWFRKYFGM